MKLIKLSVVLAFALVISCSKSNLKIEVEGPFKFNTKIKNEAITFLPYKILFNYKINRIMVLDTKKCKLLILSPEGEFINEIGKKGEAKGEFASPIAFDIDRGGRIYVLDNKRIKIFNVEGIELKSFTSKGMPWRICVRDTDDIYIITSMPVDGKIILRYNWSGKIINTYLPARIEENPFIQMLSNQSSITCDKKGNIYVAFANEYKIAKIGTDGKVDENYISGSVPYKIIKPHKRKKSDEKMMSLVIADITTDERGNLYVLWGENEGKLYYRVDVYNKDGKLIGFMNLKTPERGFFSSIAVHSTSLYVCEVRSDGLVYQFKMRELP